MRTVFDLCVVILNGIATITGTDSVTVNVVLFCLLLPGTVVKFLLVIVRQRQRIRALEQKLRA